MTDRANVDVDVQLPGIEAHPHARAVLGPVLKGTVAPSHAYLFYGPAGTGKRAIARAFAAALLMDGARAPDTVAERVARDAHPDLTWVTPSGAAERTLADAGDLVATLKDVFDLDVPEAASLWPKIALRHEDVLAQKRAAESRLP